MKKLAIILTTCLLLGGIVYADEGKGEEGDPGVFNKSSSLVSSSDSLGSEGGVFHRNWEKRKEFRLTREQREKMREAVFKYKENRIHLEESVKLARLNYRKIVTDPTSDIKAAKAAAQEIADGVSKMIAAKLALKNQITFQILTAKQREARNFMRKGWDRKGHSHWRGEGRQFSEESPQEDGLNAGPMISMDDSVEE